jgi:predicted nucleic-acid-binding Zn-ribbon protein
MKEIACPKCGSRNVHHYTDAYVLRTPVIREDGSIELLEYQTNEYDDCFFECYDCGYRPTEDELLTGDLLIVQRLITVGRCSTSHD